MTSKLSRRADLSATDSVHLVRRPEGVECSHRVPARRRPRIRAILFRTTASLLIILVAGAIHAQERPKHKIPGVDKITSGASHQAFSGKVQSVDLEEHVLEVNALESKNVEIFSVKKGVSVRTADGDKLKLSMLTPGTNIIVYYDQNGDRRTVKNIVVLAGADTGKKKKSPPPS